jgi:anti-sigma regulatory factor (Ser/Thr protein kinase)
MQTDRRCSNQSSEHESRHIDLAGDRSAARQARAFAQEALADWHRENMMDEVSLAVSELVTNAVVHAESDVTLTLVDLDSVVQIRVQDDQPKPPQVRRAATYETGGRGLQIVTTLSSRWGVDPAPPGKVVWLDITGPQSEAVAIWRDTSAP